MMRAWDDYLKALDKELGVGTVNRWLRSIKVLNFDAANLYLEASDTFHAGWITEHILPKASKDFRNENNRPVKIHLQVANKKNIPKKELESKTPSLFQIFVHDPIDSEYKLENLVELSQNKITYKLFSDFKSYNLNSTPSYNPIYIYGPEGIGKTHLLQATATLLKKQHIKANYVKLLTFTQNMVAAIKTGRMPEFRQFYRDSDVLIIDDIQHLSNKSTTQEELFHTFNALHTEGKQIIISSNLSPGELKNIEPRLISRFEWGIVLPIHGPTAPQLKKILNQKCTEVKFSLSEDAKNFLVSKFSKSPKVLARALSALILRAHLKRPQGLTFDTAELPIGSIETLLADLIKEEVRLEVTEKRILSRVAQYYKIEVEDIIGKSQSREYVLPRQVAMYLCREHLKLPFMKIGQIFNRDHSTVMSSVKQIQKNILQNDSNYSKVISALKQALFPSPVESSKL